LTEWLQEYKTQRAATIAFYKKIVAKQILSLRIDSQFAMGVGLPYLFVVVTNCTM
jgi:hypothetical protein